MRDSASAGKESCAGRSDDPGHPPTRRSLDNVHGDRISVIFLGADGNPERYEGFADGFLTATHATSSRRPVHLLVLDDGSMLVSDDQAEAIYRIWYDG